MRDYITVHGTIKRSERLERAVAEVIKQIRLHEKLATELEKEP